MEGAMRVSVVATGIDASEVMTDIPVPRRSLAQPLTQTVSAEQTAPAAEETVAQAPAAQEPTLFEEMDAQRAAAEDQMEDIFEDEPAAVQPAADDLPPPAYQPQVAQFQPQNDALEVEPDAFVAPRAPAAGTPSPEAMARLQAAVHKAPGAGGHVREVPAAAAASQQQQQPQEHAAAPQDGEKPRFGINSLINRMTGHGAEGAAPQQSVARQQPPVRAQQPAPQPVAEADPDQDRIEIPAFLRRQAN